MKKNDLIQLNIDSCSVNGYGVGRYEGMAVFVPSVCIGEKIDAHILKVKKTYAFAKVNDVITASQDRAEPLCPVYLKCGGCVFAHMNYAAEAKIKEEHVRECFNRIAGLSVPSKPIIAADEPCRYRNKAQYPLEMKDGKLNIGFYSAHSHRVINCRDCSLQPEEFEAILGVFEKYIESNRVSIYDETEHRGLLRHIYLRKAQVTGQIMVCAVINGNSLPNQAELIKALLDENENIKSIVLNINKEKTNVILGSVCKTVYGTDYIEDILCGKKFRISPLSFYQVNHDMAQKLYEKAAEYADLSGNEVLLDLYCGTGTIGLTMADRVRKLVGVEIIPQAIENAKINAGINGIENTQFICGDASVAAAYLADEGLRPDVVVLDPPRKGCDESVLKTVSAMQPEKIVYISCDPATLARDVKILSELNYKSLEYTPVDLFPRTGHVETVCLMERH